MDTQHLEIKVDNTESKNTKNIKIYTSYYASKLWKEKGMYPISIARHLPRWITYMDELGKMFAPPQYLIDNYKSGKIDDVSYKKLYERDVLDKINSDDMDKVFEKLKDKGKDVVFLCYEKTGDFCHRYLLTEFLNDKGYRVEELTE